MKLALKVLTVFTAISIFIAPAHAAGKGAKGKKKKSEPATQPQPATPKSPSEDLATFLGANLDRLLSPFDTGKGERRETDKKVFNRETDMKVLKVPLSMRTEVTKLDQQFRANASAASPAEQPVFQRAVVVTTGLTQLMDERDKQTVHFIDSRTTRPLSDLAVNNTKNQRKDARQEIHETKNFFSAGIEQQWLQTATRYRQQVNSHMDLLRSAERQAKPATPAP